MKSRRLILEPLEPRALLALLPPHGLVGWFQGEGNPSDFTGQEFGELDGSPSFAAGQIGRAFTFDSDDDRVIIRPNNDHLNVQGSGFTAEFWMKAVPHQSPTRFFIVSKSFGIADPAGWAFQNAEESGRIRFVVNDATSGSPPVGVTSAADLLDGNFHHIAGTWDGSTVRLYVDGVLQGSAPLVTPATNGQPVQLAASWNDDTAPNEFFRGQIDELHFFNRALSHAEIAAIAGAASDGLATIIVTTTADSEEVTDGVTSFREAITQANATLGYRDVVGFNIPGAGVHTIVPATTLPAITDPIVIDGYTQPGASPNTNRIDQGSNAILRIEIDVVRNLFVDALTIEADNSIFRGLATNALVFTSSSNRIEGCFIGTSAAGTSSMESFSHGVFLSGNGNVIGGLTPAARNVISGNSSIGVRLFGNNNLVQGNIVGLAADGVTLLSNGSTGVSIRGSNNTIGGTTGAARNVVSGNSDAGIGILGPTPGSATGNLVQGNFIGTDVTGTLAIDHSHPSDGGIRIDGYASNNTIGGIEVGAGNVIAGRDTGVSVGPPGSPTTSTIGNRIQGNYFGTDLSGVLSLGIITGISLGIDSVGTLVGGEGASVGKLGVEGFAGNLIAHGGQGIYIERAQQSHIEGNTIFANRGTGIAVSHFRDFAVNNAFLRNSISANEGLGIDLLIDGPSANDAGDVDSGPNNLQNHPEVLYATRTSGLLRITYRLPSDPANTTFPVRVEFFKADANGQEGQTYLGFDTLTVAEAAAGQKTITFAGAAPMKGLEKIVATATDSLSAGGPANTSEFSPFIVFASPWTNPRHRLDVNDDRSITADDALTVINQINAFGTRPVPADAVSEPDYLDTNSDDTVSASDALAVINHINAFGTGPAEGESPPVEILRPGTELEPAILAGDLLALLAADSLQWAERKKR